MQRTGGDADQRADEGQRQREQDRHPRAENHPGQHVPGLIVGAQPVDLRRWTRRRLVEVVIGCVVAERDRRKQHPAAVLVNQLLHVFAAVVGLKGQLPAKFLFGVAFECREIQRALITDHQRFVVGDQLAAQGQQEQADK
ncbi:hypothetical protein ACFS4T_20695 [Pseudomonas lini]